MLALSGAGQSPPQLAAFLPSRNELSSSRICVEGDTTPNGVAAILRSFRPSDRSHLRVVNDVGSLCGMGSSIVVDTAYSSPSAIFDAFKEINSNTMIKLIIDLRSPTQPFPCWIGVLGTNNEVQLANCVEILGRENYVGAKDGVPGQFIPPLIESPSADVIYSADRVLRVFVATDQSIIQMAVTVGLEIGCHALPWVLGQEWRHPEVDKCVKQVEQEAESNAATPVSGLEAIQ